ncbi:hypothetical protein VTI74DRAFT_8332 [Chaetomium olivicolor]
MSPTLDFYQAYLPRDLHVIPLANTGLVVAIVLFILSLDYLNYRGYDTFSKKSKPWAYWGQHDDFIVVVPPGTCDEIKNADLSKLSFLQAVEDSYHFRLHSNILGRGHVDAVRQSVNKNMNQLHNVIVTQSEETIPQVLDGYAKSQEPFAAFMTIWHLVHVIAASYLIGPEFSRNAEYMKAIESYCLDIPAFVHLYFWVPAPLRRAFWYLSPQGFRVRATIKKLKRFVIPEVRNSIDNWRKTGRTRDQYTLLGAMLDLKNERGQINQDAGATDEAEEERQIQVLADELMFTAFDSAGPVACLVTQMLFESIQHPDIVRPLRNEIASALAAHGGEWSPEMLSSLPRLESFTRETLRVDGPTLFSVTRTVLQPMQLKSGLALSRGTIISSPAWFIHNDEDYYPGASEFNPWRFYNEGTNMATTKATTASNTFLGYGYGSQICPGRFLGIRITQILFANILMRYDAEFEDVQNGKPENLFMPGQVLPHYRARIVLKEREGVKLGKQLNIAATTGSNDGQVDKKGQDAATPKAGFGTLLRVLRYSTPINRGVQVVCVFAALCSGAAMPLMALVLGRLTANLTQFGSVDTQVTPGEFMQQVKTNTLWFVYLFIGKFLVYVWSFGFTYAASGMVQALRLACLDRILSRNVSEHDVQTPGSLSAILTLQCNSIQTAFSDRMGIMIQAFSMLIAAFVVAFTQSWQLTLVMLGLVFLTLALIGIVVSTDQKIEAGLLKRYETCIAIAEDALGSIRTVIAFGAANKFLNKYKTVLDQAEKDGKKRGPLVGLMFACQFFFMFTGWAIGFYLGGYLYKTGRVSDSGKILAVFFAMLIGLGAIMALGPNMPSFQKAVAGAGVVFKLLDDENNTETTRREKPASIPGAAPEHQTHTGDLELRNLSFAYPSRSGRPALSNVSLHFARGTSTAVVGPSGAGKSTLISLLERWYEPTAGSILIDGHDIIRVDVRWLRRQIALVQQEPQLFSASIFENVAHGLVGTEYENASDKEKKKLVEKACQEARAYEFIRRLPQGLDTIVGNQGSLLSGGQKQRIAIARALIGRRPILLMDEATSALDTANSAVIEQLMDPSPNRTTIFISHKISTAKRAGRIVVLEGGSVIEQGTHEELIRADGLYKRLHDTQVPLEVEENGPSAVVEKVSIEKGASSLPDGPDPAGIYSSTQMSDELPEIPKRSLFVNLWTIAKEQKRFWPILLTGVAASMVTAQIFPVQGILLGRTLQSFQKPLGELVSDANFYSLMFFVVGLGALISYAILGFFMTLLGIRLTKFYRFEYFRAVLLQPRIDFFDRVASGTLASRLSSDPANLHDLISVNLGLLVSIFVSLISGSIIALAYSWKLGLVAIFGAMPFVFAAGFIRMKLDSSLAETAAKIFEDSAGFAFDALSVIRTVKAYTLEDTVRQSYQQHLSTIIGKLYRKTALIMLFFALSESIELLAGALTFWYGGTLRRDGQLSTGAFFTVFISVVVGGQAAGALFGFSSNLSKAKIAANNILGLRSQVRQAVPQDETADGTAYGEKATDAIVDFQNVSFAYPTRPGVAVLKSISLQVFPGQTIGIVGASGSGKSTLLALLERFYEAQSGRLSVFGKPMSMQDPHTYRKRLAIVSQEPTLFRGSVRENILLGVDEDQVGEEEMVQAAEAANLTECIASLPEGYDTDCGARGISLSGGQKQRVAIARALVRKPELLLLDEPTSALDAESERRDIIQLVLDTFRSIRKGRTVILVTHHLNMARDVDIIFVMSGGEIVEQGSHGELMALRGHYFGMYQESLGDRI